MTALADGGYLGLWCTTLSCIRICFHLNIFPHQNIPTSARHLIMQVENVLRRFYDANIPDRLFPLVQTPEGSLHKHAFTFQILQIPLDSLVLYYSALLCQWHERQRLCVLSQIMAQDQGCKRP